MLNIGKSRVDVDIQTLMMIDSLDMTDKNRVSLLDSCKSAEEKKIIITHGTD